MGVFKILILMIMFTVTQGEDWVRLNGDNRISFLFPNRGESSKKDVNGMRTFVFQTKNVTSVFGVVCTELTKDEETLDSYTMNQLYLKMKNETLQMPTVELKSEKIFTQNRQDVKEICYTIMKNDEEMTYFRRYIFRANCLYQLNIGAKTEDLEELLQQKEKFFNSVTFKS